jgi:potassium large conductance calcium-activated channel subfamily M alpha member 1
MGLIERPRTIRIVQLAARFIAVWFSAAGAVHLAENSGDFFCNFGNAQELEFFNSVYFMIVTMTTVSTQNCSTTLPLNERELQVGYGDVFCKTYIGKFFMLLFLIGGLVSSIATK